MSNEALLSIISEVTELNDLSSFMQDEQLDIALANVIKLTAKPEIPPASAHRLIVQLQAISSKCAIQATIYKTLRKGPSGSDNAYKKDLYYTLASTLDRLVDALKYTARYGT